MNRYLLAFLLFLLFLAYRLHFWGYDLAWHCFLNAAADVAIATPCGILIYHLNQENSNKGLLTLSIFLLVAFTFCLFYTHKAIYSFTNILDGDFNSMFHTLCFQLLDSFSIIITGALVNFLALLSSEKENIKRNLEQLSIAKDKEELKHLKTKINPHFIFNGLNSIYHEIDSDKVFAKDRIIQFADIVRYHLQYAAEEKVDFEVELQYLKSYIEFQYQSTADFLTLEQDYSIEDSETEIPPLLFIPFLENAFKYCDSTLNSKGKIKVGFNFNKNWLKMNLSNTYDPEHRKTRASNSFGLQNVIKRLELHYAGKYHLDIEDQADQKLYSCQLQINLQSL